MYCSYADARLLSQHHMKGMGFQVTKFRHKRRASGGLTQLKDGGNQPCLGSETSTNLLPTPDVASPPSSFRPTKLAIMMHALNISGMSTG